MIGRDTDPDSYAEGFEDALIRCHTVAHATACGATAVAQQIKHHIDRIRVTPPDDADDEEEEVEGAEEEVEGAEEGTGIYFGAAAQKPAGGDFATQMRAGLKVIRYYDNAMFVEAPWEAEAGITREEAAELAHLFGTFYRTGRPPDYLYVPGESE